MPPPRRRRRKHTALEFHDVIFSVSDILPGSVIRDSRQTITARVVLKLRKAEVQKLQKMTAAYLDGYQEGMDPLLVTSIGKFTK